jgi:8-oxo-dGTP pyrophosphatase MutT (NUDIX family)
MIASGALFFSIHTKRFLFLLRNNTRTKNTWGLCGGKLIEGESVIEGLNREIEEEIGFLPKTEKIIPLDKFVSFDGGFEYHSFIFVLENEFIPILNDEHDGYCWVSLEKHPKPLHPGLWNSISTKEILEKIKYVEGAY